MERVYTREEVMSAFGSVINNWVEVADSDADEMLNALSALPKPEYTQAMSDAGELPPAGCFCLVNSGCGWMEAFIVGRDQTGSIVCSKTNGGVFKVEPNVDYFKPLPKVEEAFSDALIVVMSEDELKYNREAKISPYKILLAAKKAGIKLVREGE